MDQLYYYQDASNGDNKAIGPVSASDIYQLLVQGIIKRDCNCWTETQSIWLPIQQSNLMKLPLFQHIPATTSNTSSGGGGSGDNSNTGNSNDGGVVKKSAKRKRAPRKTGNKWRKNAPNTHVYVEGLPLDVTMDEMVEFFKKAGIIKEDGVTGAPVIKLYKDDEGKLKGDGRIGYLRPESVNIACTVLDGAAIRDDYVVSVKPAVFQMKGDVFETKRVRTVAAADQDKVKKSQMSKLSWAEAGDETQGLKIVILEYMFVLDDVVAAEQRGERDFYDNLKVEVGMECERKCGPIEKVTVFENNPQGVVAVRFKAASSAEKCIELMDGRYFDGRRVKCSYYDGVTNYKVKESDAEMEARHKRFGDWLEADDDGAGGDGAGDKDK